MKTKPRKYIMKLVMGKTRPGPAGVSMAVIRLYLTNARATRAVKNLGFLQKVFRFLGFLDFNV